jgi:hypothetical protein
MLKKVTTKDATKPLIFIISKDNIEAGECKNPNECVIAKAIQKTLGDFCDQIEVGCSITKLITGNTVVRYATPNNLRKAVKSFDLTGEWSLPPGEFKLLPPSKTAKLGARPSRWHRVHVKKTQAGRDAFQGRALPTRKVSRAKNIDLVVS